MKRVPSDPLEIRKRLSGEARKASIVAAAAQLFAEQGFGGSTREIAQRLGVTQALLYRYFPSKDALIEGVFEVHRRPIDPQRALKLTDRSRPLVDRVCDFYEAYQGRNTSYSGVRLFMHAALAGIDFALRYSPDLDEMVIRPLLDAWRAEVGLDPAPRPLPRLERDLVLNMHGAIVFIGIRRRIYGAAITDDRHAELVREIVKTWLPGALDRLSNHMTT